MGGHSSVSKSFPFLHNDISLGSGVSDQHPGAGSTLLHLPGRCRLLQHLLPAHRSPNEQHSMRTAQLALGSSCCRCGPGSATAKSHPTWTTSFIHPHSFYPFGSHPLRRLLSKLVMFLPFSWCINKDGLFFQVRQMCRHLNIWCFKLKPRKEDWLLADSTC